MISSIIYHLSPIEPVCKRLKREKMDSMRDNCSDVMHLREKKNPRQLFNLSFSYLQARAGDNQMRRFYWVV
jgi:hypothetical protein